MGNFPGTQEQPAQPLNNWTIKKLSDFFFTRSTDAEGCSPKSSAGSRDCHGHSCSSVCHYHDIHSYSSEKEVSGLWVTRGWWVHTVMIHFNHFLQAMGAGGPALLRTQQPEPTSQACDLENRTGPRAQKNPQLGLITYCHHLKILDFF